MDQNLIQCMDNKYGERRWKLLQDNARPHVADTIQYLQDQGVRLIDHPPYSPDLNPIEQIWAWMKHDVCSTTYETVDEMMTAIEEKWSKLTLELMNKVIDHHCNVIPKVLAAKGAYI